MECSVHRLVADVAALADGRVLMVRYLDTSAYDRQKGWFLPDDFLQHLEHPDDAARRILTQQVGVTPEGVARAKLHGIESFDGQAWHLVFHYRADLDSVPTLSPSTNVAAAEWFDLGDLPARSDVAHHGWALDTLEGMLAAGPSSNP